MNLFSYLYMRMGIPLLPYDPVEGKTYSLFGNGKDTTTYYNQIRNIADELLLENEPVRLLSLVRRAGRENGLLKSIVGGTRGRKLLQQLLASHRQDMQQYLRDVGNHLRSVKLLEGYKSVLWTTGNQYLLYMLEIELSNRMNIDAFNGRTRRFALLPHCLRDTWGTCKAESGEFDLACRHCRAECYINHLSKILEQRRVEPYLWTTRNLKSLYREFASTGDSFGVLGVACIPELVMGLRRSGGYGIPAVGLPLNANNCIRWRGTYMKNSVDLDQLQHLLTRSG